MAIAKMKKIEVVGLGRDKDGLLALFQKLQMVELINIQEPNQPPGRDISVKADSGLTHLPEIEEAVSFLSGLKEKSGFFGGGIGLKPSVNHKQLKEVVSGFDWQAFLSGLSALRQQFKDLIQQKEKLSEKTKLLNPWRKLTLSLDELFPTRHCGFLLGVLSSRDYPNFLDDIAKAHTNLFSAIIHQDKSNTHLLIIYLNEEFPGLETLLKNYRFNLAALGHSKGTVEDNLSRINSEALILDQRINEVKHKIAELSKEHFRLCVVHDYLADIKKRGEAIKNLAQQEFTFALSGWMRDKDATCLEKEISLNFKDTALFISNLAPDDNPPVALENNRLIQPFEFITQIYGMPQYGELDPTPFLAPFFFLYFGFCISDAGYGILLVLMCWMALKKFRMGPQGKKFFKLFLYCGISTIIVGALTGSWFGNLIDLLGENQKMFLPLRRIKDAMIVLDPIKEPTKLLGIALSLGIIQVWFGNIVAAIGNLKNKRYQDIFFDQLPMLTLLFGLTGLGLIFLNLLDKTNAALFQFATLIGSLGLIMTQGRSEKELGGKIFYGVYNLYNALSGYLSDVLSYSRLWALGLVTGVMANTINMISVQFSQIFISIIPFINRIGILKVIISSVILIIIFVFGHTVSFAMNLLGAFVHPVRLQFVEFFSKFFKSGGRAFKPLKVETKYINFS